MKQFIKYPTFILATLFLAGTFASCGSGDSDADVVETDTMQDRSGAQSTDQRTVTAVITATYPDTTVTGSANFTTQADGQVRLDIELKIPAKANKEVAVHLHEHGDCGDEGNNAHGHWNPTNEDHGKWGAAPFHRGDIGNVSLDAQGNGTLQMTTDLWEIGGNDSTKNIVGKALIVHGGSDDFVSQPTGNAGNRIGCGVIQ